MRDNLRWWSWLAALLLAVSGGVVRGQDSGDQDSAADISSQLAIGAGVRSFAPGKWGLVRADVANRSAEDTEFTALTFFEGHPHEQFGRTFWVPAGARRTVWYLVRAPQDSNYEQSFEVRSKLFRSSDEVAIRQEGGQMHQHGLVAAGRDTPRTGFILTTSTDEETIQDEQFAFDAVIAARLAGGATRRLSFIYDPVLPPAPEALEAVDQLIIANDRLADDAAATAAVRQWIAAGGTAWIMLDQVEPETVYRLLGDAFQGQRVDTVGLNEFEIETVKPLAGKIPEPVKQSFEDPMTFARYIVSDVEVISQVRGWPAAFYREVGRGKVFFTTLAPRAWLRYATPEENAGENLLYDAEFRALPPLEAFSQYWLQEDKRIALGPEELRPYLTEQIGYQIVGRGVVISILAAFCIVLTVCGVILARKGKMAHMGWIGPSIALACTLPLVVLAVSSKQAVPPTLAVAQLVHVGEGTDELRASGLLAFYRPESRPDRLGQHREGVFETRINPADTRRLIRTDIDQWHWEDFTLDPGVRLAPFHFTARTERPASARAHFGSRGLEGELILPASIQDPEDAIVALPPRNQLALEFAKNGSFVVRPKDLLARRQYLSSTLLSNEQRRRRLVYQSLLGDPGPMSGEPRPVVYFWSQPVPLVLQGTEDMRTVGSALVEVPLTIERTAPDIDVQIPAPFIGYRTLTNDTGRFFSSLYDHRTDSWLKVRGPRDAWMHFQMPPQVTPLELSRVTLDIKINAPSRTLTVKARKGTEDVMLFERTNPSGAFQIEIDDPELLTLDEQGRLLLGLFVSNATGSNSTIVWNIDSLHLAAEGRTLSTSE